MSLLGLSGPTAENKLLLLLLLVVVIMRQRTRPLSNVFLLYSCLILVQKNIPAQSAEKLEKDCSD